jgi:methyl-accepting chemotaxis protein
MVGLLTAVAILVYALEELKIEGPKYSHIIDAKDLVADILPPPMFVVEPYMLVLEVSDDPKLAGAHVAKLKKMEQDDHDRLDYWAKSELPDSLKSLIRDKLTPATLAFWKSVDDGFVPALSTGDQSAYRKQAKMIGEQFLVQKAAVEDLVSAANAYQIDSEANAREASSMLLRYSAAAAVLAMLLLTGGLWVFRKRAIVPLEAISAYMRQLAKGEYQVEVPYLDRHDEIGDIAASVDVFRAAGLEKIQLEAENRSHTEAAEAERMARINDQARQAQALQKVVTDLRAGLNRLSQCDIRQTLDEPFETEFEVLRNDFNASMAIFQVALVEVLNKAGEINQGCQSMRESSDHLSKRTEQQAAALEQTAAALEQISTNVKNSADRANITRGRAQEAKRDVIASSRIVKDAVEAMERIEAASQQIGSITGVIDQIAFQTNLLALNAGVEAARAGEAGKGFAVVAQEVRELAQRSATAAKEISALIGKSNDEVAGGVDLVRNTGAALEKIENYIGDISGDIDAIATAAQEQSLGLTEVNVAVNQMDQITQQNAAMVEEMAAATHDLAEDAGELSGLVNNFKLNRRLSVRDTEEAKRRTAERMSRAA